MIGTKTKLAVAAGVALVVAVVVAPRLRPKPAPPSPPAPISSNAPTHGASIDRQFASYFALYNAPEGATPCESAYDAFQNSIDVAAQLNVKPVVTRLAPKDEFLARCAAVPSDHQLCLVPRYRRDHDEECKRTKPPDDVLRELRAMVEMQPATVKLDGPPGSAASASASP